MTMQYRTTRSREKDPAPTPVVREQWGTSGRKYDPEINTHKPTFTSEQMVMDPATGVSTIGAGYLQEVNDCRDTYDSWPPPAWEYVRPTDNVERIEIAVRHLVQSGILDDLMKQDGSPVPELSATVNK